MTSHLYQANSIVCPNCETEIEISEAIESKIRSRLHAESLEEFNTERTRLAQKELHIDQKRKLLEDDTKNLADKIETCLNAERASMLAQARIQVAADFEMELKDRV